MARSLSQIGATIPLGGALGVGLKRARREIQQSLGEQTLAHVEGETHGTWRPWGKNRLEGKQVAFDLQHVRSSHFGVGWEWHHRIKVFARVPDTIMHRRKELVVTPTADTGARVGRDVRRNQDAIRGWNFPAAGKCRSARARMAGHAIRGAGHIKAAANDQSGPIRLRRWRCPSSQRNQRRQAGAPPRQRDA